MVPGTQKRLTASPPPLILETKNGRAVCPICKRLLNVSVARTTEARDLPAWCRRCGWQGQVDIADGVCSTVSPNR